MGPIVCKIRVVLYIIYLYHSKYTCIGIWKWNVRIFGKCADQVCRYIVPSNIHAMSSPPSLRDLYIDPAQTWAFTTPTPPPNTTITSPAPPTTPPIPVAQSYQWSTRPSHNSIFDLSPSLDLSEPTGINAAQLFKAFVASAVLQYTSNAIAMPWEVGKLLLQVQWVPRDAGEPEPPYAEDDHEEAVRFLFPSG